MQQDRFDAFLQRVREATGIASQNELAEALGVNRSAITQARRKNAVPERWILRLFRGFGLNPQWLESGTGSPFLASADDGGNGFQTVPKVRARLCAGGGSFEVGAEVEAYCAFQGSWLRKKGTPDTMVLLNIFGNSMEPELRDGDTVLVDESQKDVLSGAVFAVGIDDTIMVKRLEKHPSKLVLLSDNTRYAPIFLEGSQMASVRILGKVVWSCREFR
jgi:phage repressor protein C with HTH and peptisase S24 domain